MSRYFLQTEAVTSTEQVLCSLAALWGFPDYFGKNLDALADCLSEISPVTALNWQGWQQFAAAQPRDFQTIQEIFRDAQVVLTLVN